MTKEFLIFDSDDDINKNGQEELDCMGNDLLKQESLVKKKNEIINENDRFNFKKLFEI